MSDQGGPSDPKQGPFANVFPVLSSGGDGQSQIDSGYLPKVEVIRGSGRSAYRLSQRERERDIQCQGGEDGEKDRESERAAVLVLSRDGSARGQDYLLAVFGVQGENKLLLIFAVKCLSCLQTDCGQRIICFICIHICLTSFSLCPKWKVSLMLRFSHILVVSTLCVWRMKSVFKGS